MTGWSWGNSLAPWALSFTRPAGRGRWGSDAPTAELAICPVVGGARPRFQGPPGGQTVAVPQPGPCSPYSHPGDRVHLCHRGHCLAHSVLHLLQRSHCQERHTRYVSHPRAWKFGHHQRETVSVRAPSRLAGRGSGRHPYSLPPTCREPWSGGWAVACTELPRATIEGPSASPWKPRAACCVPRVDRGVLSQQRDGHMAKAMGSEASEPCCWAPGVVGCRGPQRLFLQSC